MWVTAKLRGNASDYAVARPDLPDVAGAGARPDGSGLYVAALSVTRPTSQRTVRMTLVKRLEPRTEQHVTVLWLPDFVPDTSTCPQCDGKGCRFCDTKGTVYVHTVWREVYLEHHQSEDAR